MQKDKFTTKGSTMKKFICGILGILLSFTSFSMENDESKMIIRIARISVYPEYLEQYKIFLREIGQDSMEKESGVISSFSMQQLEDPTKISIVEIYKNQDAYKKHIESDHFLKYKKGTQKMISDLKLEDYNAISNDMLPKTFLKLK